MATPLNSLATYIATDLGLGTVATNVFLDHQPDAPDTCITVYDTGGSPPALTQGDDTDCPSFQIRSRSLDAGTALSNLQTIFAALHGLTETAVHSTHFKLIAFKQSNPVPLGRDAKQRFEFVMNANALVRGVTR